MPQKKETQWLFRIHIADRAGALTSIASAFSNRGLSLDTVVGHGNEGTALSTGGSVIVTFNCTRNEKDTVLRVIRRLTKITDVEEYPYRDDDVRKSALVKVKRKLKPVETAGEKAFLTCELVTIRPDETMYFLAGPPHEVDFVLQGLRKKRILLDTVYSVVAM